MDDYTLNPYSGCSFNCLFCYIRGSKYGTHMEDKLGVKENAEEVLDRQLHNRAKKGQYGVIVFSSATEPYLQFEEKLMRTRNLLSIILKHRFPVHMLTRSHLIERDIDLLHQIDRTAILPQHLQHRTTRGVFVTFSFSTTDDKIAKIFEPGATPPSIRLTTLKKMLDAGFHSGVSMMPMLPYITDTGAHLHELFTTFKKLGAHYLYPAGLTLFGNETSDSRTLVFRAVEKYYPELLPRYQKLFSASDYLPAYYQQAFAKKMKELSDQYNLPQLIC